MPSGEERAVAYSTFLDAWRLQRRTRCRMENSLRVPICGRDKCRDFGANGASARKEGMPSKQKRLACRDLTDGSQRFGSLFEEKKSLLVCVR